MAGGSLSGGVLSSRDDCAAAVRIGEAADAAAEVRRKRRRLIMNATSVMGKFAHAPARGKNAAPYLEPISTERALRLRS